MQTVNVSAGHPPLIKVSAIISITALCALGLLFATANTQGEFFGRSVGGVLLAGSTLTLIIIGSQGILRHIGTLRRDKIFQSALQNQPIAISLVDSSGTIMFANEKMTRAFNVSKGVNLAASSGSGPGLSVTEIQRVHDLCKSVGTVDETFHSGNEKFHVTVNQMDKNQYQWSIFETEHSASDPFAGHDVAILEFGKTGKILGGNSQFHRHFPSHPQTLRQLSKKLAQGIDGPVSLDTVQGPKSFLAQISKTDSDNGSVFLFPQTNALQNRSLNAQDIFEHIPVALIRMSVEGEIFAVNACARSVLKQQVHVGQQVRDVFSATNTSISNWLKSASESTEPGPPEFLRCIDTAKDQVLQASLTKFKTDDDCFFVCNLSDVTELKSLEAQFVQSQKMQAIGQLAGGVAHDFNNLLTAISGHCDLLLLRHGPDDPDYADLMQIHQNANRAGSLVGQLLAFSRKQKLQLQALNLRDTLADLGHLLNRLVGEKVKLQLNHGQDLNPVRADKRQLEQILMNLVVNARDAMPRGGTVEIITEQVRIDRPTERESAIIPPGEYAVVTVSDQGTGIRPDQISKIFEPFFTTKRTGEGTGLGLSTVYGIVKQSGGFIFVESTLGEGTTFEVMLQAPPLTKRVKIEEEPQMNASVSTQSEGVVLLVEDEAPVRAFASRALQLEGFEVLEADCAESALEILEDDALHIDAFVTDVVMPGMDGPTWVAKAQKDRPNVQVVFVSGYAEDCLEGNEEAFENAAFLAKPFSLNDLTKTVQSVIS